ncbi:HPF/RaiA family ribosome-associated protein [Candidatus Dojkabacteria bacterium]|nr:HPF/RaiA family ribosome-associated protein [Candidatus Dojkabacteria bacterium]
MKVMLDWGNLEAEQYDSKLSKLLDKNVNKIKRFVKKVDESTVKLEIHFEFDPHKKVYNVSLHLVWPHNNHYVEEKGFTFEEAISVGMKELKRVILKNKEKRISLNRIKVEV